ncbi:MAG TPA: TlpA disulfide reductase family protein [Polyangia bacterium]|jgi:thiol-disulfide isomerase/thioredoxin|nr:TlpA disulfide reductase family protein [Polyangia bacterium]
MSQVQRSFGLAMVALVVIGCAGAPAARSDEPASEGDGATVGAPVPAIAVRTVDGKRTVDLAKLKGKVVLLDIWASWCGPCREELPLLDEMAARLKSKGVVVVAVSIDEEKDAAQAFLAARDQWTLTVAHDPKGIVPALMQPPKMPTSYLIDARGVLRYVNAGFDRADARKIEDRLVALAAEVR